MGISCSAKARLQPPPCPQGWYLAWARKGPSVHWRRRGAVARRGPAAQPPPAASDPSKTCKPSPPASTSTRLWFLSFYRDLPVWPGNDHEIQ